MEDKNTITIEKDFDEFLSSGMLNQIREFVESLSQGKYIKVRFNDKEVIDWDDLKHLVEKDEKGGHE